MRFEGASSVPRLVQKITFFGPWSCWCFGLFGSEANENLSSVFFACMGSTPAGVRLLRNRSFVFYGFQRSREAFFRRVFCLAWARILLVFRSFRIWGWRMLTRIWAAIIWGWRVFEKPSLTLHAMWKKGAPLLGVGGMGGSPSIRQCRVVPKAKPSVALAIGRFRPCRRPRK